MAHNLTVQIYSASKSVLLQQTLQSKSYTYTSWGRTSMYLGDYVLQAVKSDWSWAQSLPFVHISIQFS